MFQTHTFCFRLFDANGCYSFAQKLANGCEHDRNTIAIPLLRCSQTVVSMTEKHLSPPQPPCDSSCNQTIVPEGDLFAYKLFLALAFSVMSFVLSSRFLTTVVESVVVHVYSTCIFSSFWTFHAVSRDEQHRRGNCFNLKKVLQTQIWFHELKNIVEMICSRLLVFSAS